MKFNLKRFKVWWFGHTRAQVSKIDVYIGLLSFILSMILFTIFMGAVIRWGVYTFVLSIDTVFLTAWWKSVWNIIFIGLLITMYLHRDK